MFNLNSNKMPVKRKKSTSAKRKTRVVYRKAKTAVRRKRRGLSAGPLGRANCVDPLLLPYGLQDGGQDYAGLSEDIYASNYANVY
ncbi:MAG: hypothetical protein EBS18_02405 [Actinobacteria bacterium]|nr:hypothetical protein [Actinomycetota bacterium]